MMAFQESEGCHARVDKHVTQNGGCRGLESSCALISGVCLFAAVSNQDIWVKKSRVPSNPETFLFTKKGALQK